jgi:4-hydroxythreonine-4-phosphate dehydrogenase
VTPDFIPRIALTCGEPAGIGPEITVSIAAHQWPAQIVVIGDAQLLQDRARLIGSPIEIVPYDKSAPASPGRPGQIFVAEQTLHTASMPAVADSRNSPWVIETLRRACQGCMSGEFAAMVTGPVNKGLINDAGIAFTGHTEFLADETGSPQPVMMLVADDLRVALVTTHLALRDVPRHINKARLKSVLQVAQSGLNTQFGIEHPNILVLGLNPHAGESGHLGMEEIEIMQPVLDELRATGMQLSGPLPADTAFTPAHLANADAVVAMYHDQGLPVLKHRGFGKSINVTLGLPIIRTSVDHGTALDLAGSGTANSGSLHAAIELAIDMALKMAINMDSGRAQ